ncbi:hypothetical protein [Nonomuraea sp. NPDC046570]|uniref:hypothetical protein n=1 Tax=Nonomuraea sp. NPDC046570 TaxID=3155255 RepID=UPI0033D40CAB
MRTSSTPLPGGAVAICRNVAAESADAGDDQFEAVVEGAVAALSGPGVGVGCAGLFLDRVAVDVGQDGVHGDVGRAGGDARDGQGGDEAVEGGDGLAARVVEGGGELADVSVVMLAAALALVRARDQSLWRNSAWDGDAPMGWAWW